MVFLSQASLSDNVVKVTVQTYFVPAAEVFAAKLNFHALTAAAQDSEIVDELENFDIKDYSTISELFKRFPGVNLEGKDSWELLVDWGLTVKGILFYNTLYPLRSLRDEAALTDLMVDLSLHIWGYENKQ